MTWCSHSPATGLTTTSSSVSGWSLRARTVVPVYDEATFESSRPGLYLAGTMLGGLNTSAWFIENGRFHARQIARHIAARA
jgi:hypothetical protein